MNRLNHCIATAMLMKELMKMKHHTKQTKQIALNVAVLSALSVFAIVAQAQATVAAPTALEASAASKAAASAASAAAPLSAAPTNAPVSAAPTGAPMNAASAAAPASAASAGASGMSGVRLSAPLFKSDTYGVEVTGAHISASGYVVDVRYRVLNAAKAAPLLDKKVRPVIINETNGERFYVPQPPIIGSLRQTSRNNNVIVGKVYFMLFANPDKRLKPGDKVTMYVGDEKFGVLELAK